MIKSVISALKEFYERFTFTIKLLKSKPPVEETLKQEPKLKSTVIPENYNNDFNTWANKLNVSSRVPRRNFN